MRSDLPKDPYILLSFVNTQLRDRFVSLDAFCEEYEVSCEELAGQLQAIDYQYDPGRNQFI